VADLEAWNAVEHALSQAGFEREWRETVRATFTGVLDAERLAAPALVEIEDLDFCSPPVIRLRDPSAFGRVISHVLGPGGQLCYLDGRARVLDRYDPAGTVLSCVETASKVLRDAVSGATDDYLLDDFAAYWNGNFFYADLPPGAKTGEIVEVALNPPPAAASGILTRAGGLAPAFLARHRAQHGPDAEPDRLACPIIDVDGALRVDPTQPWPPLTLEAMCDWLAAVAPSVLPKLDRRFDEASGTVRHFGLRAENGLFLLQIAVPEHLRKEEFLKTRRRQLFRNLARAGGKAPVTRISTVRIDAEYLSSRNLPSGAGLFGRRIAIVGCGSIGSFLADQLVRSGAGMGGGVLTVFDPDRLMPANLGRHLLPLAALNLNKAEAVRDHLLATMPHLEVRARPMDALGALHELCAQDLVIDATGEEAVSIALNHRAVTTAGFPPCLHVWLLGNGAAAEALLRVEPDDACYKCLKPELARAPRHRVLRPEAGVEFRQNYACGDPLFVPYPISRGAGAAGLALDIALDWAAGRPSPRHRTRVFEPHATFQVKDGDPHRSSQCPACHPTP